ncbi:GIY-YIG nuclease family protein [Corynebacterium choanae]|uniref:T5orf172 domain protein n=1 Tax=Corynebacterium choanae TaxID=1862358 RepID=A0A3G6J980_9CORY|nr:GIY-YIG nuclease family protein [Corynebacterium choanae]AZA14685.1 T5orf172 domain protein [Corynebacterium choanae]
MSNEDGAPQSDLDAAFAAIFDSDVDGLLDTPEKPKQLTADDRLERAFLEVIEFVQIHGREPSADTRDISERKLGARLVGIRGSDAKITALEHLDSEGLLSKQTQAGSVEELLTGEPDDVLGDLLAENDDLFDLSALPRASVKSPESRANRVKAQEFDQFRPLFARQHELLRAGEVVPRRFAGESTIKVGNFYLIRGMLAYVAAIFEPEPNAGKAADGEPKRRLHVIFENGTESRMYVQSLAVRIYEEEGQVLAKRTLETADIFAEDKGTGHIYVLRSLSDDPEISSIDNLYKIGFTTTSVEQRIKGAQDSATYLFAPVEIVADYQLFNVQPSIVEQKVHAAFAQFRLEIEAHEAGGKDSHPSEWFVCELEQIDQILDELFRQVQ